MLPRSNKLHSMLVKYSSLSLSLSLSYSLSGFSFCHFCVAPFSFCLFYNTTFFALSRHYSYLFSIVIYTIYSTILNFIFQLFISNNYITFLLQLVLCAFLCFSMETKIFYILRLLKCCQNSPSPLTKILTFYL